MGEHVGAVGQVGLGEHDERLGAALPGQGEEAFDPAEVELDGEGDGDDGEVHVGGEDLSLGAFRGGGPHEGGAARQERLHIARGQVDGRPVARAHDVQRVAGGDEGGVGRDGSYTAVGVLDDEVAAAPVDADDAARSKAPGGVGSEAVSEPGVPAVGGEGVRSTELGQDCDPSGERWDEASAEYGRRQSSRSHLLSGLPVCAGRS
ncbi:hypothetical protein GCM10020000_17360 [Streptomyces olivoverticillatus]